MTYSIPRRNFVASNITVDTVCANRGRRSCWYLEVKVDSKQAAFVARRLDEYAGDED